MNQHVQNKQLSREANNLSKYLCMHNIAQKILNSSKSHLREELRCHGVSFKQWQILRFLSKNKLTANSKIAAYLGCDLSAVTRYLDGLEVRGLIGRERRIDDRRAIDITLTPKGESFTNNINISFEEFSEKLTNSLDGKEKNILKYVNTCLVEGKIL